MTVPADAPALETAALTVEFGGLRAVDAVSLRVAAGERCAVIGPNGAGKTTLFNAVGGQLRPTSGSVRVLGREVTRLAAPGRARLGLGRTFQISDLFGGMSVEENVRLAVAGRQQRVRRDFWRPLGRTDEVVDRAGELLREWELWSVRHQRVDTLGHGRQRVLELVLALAGEPRLLLLDEPTAGLSRREASRMADVVGALPRDLTLLLIEHDMEVAFALGERVIVLDDGAVLASGSPHEIQRDPAVVAAYLGRSE